MIIVSACLAGINCRYDGKSKPCQKVIELVKQGKAILVCPEELAGLSTPRNPIEQLNGKIITKQGEDLTEQLKKGAQEGLKVAKLHNCTKAILKSKPPTCGCGKVYDGTFSGNLIDGDGVFTRLLKDNNIDVITEEDI